MPTFDSVDPITGQGEKQKQLDREIRDMISALTRRLADLQSVQKPGGGGGVSSHHHPEHDPESHHHRHHQPHDDDNGLRIITMAGSNVGATMRSELEVMDKTAAPHDQEPNQGGSEHDQQVPLTTYLNSNFQAINNSIMLGGSYTTNDPGVHLDISEYFITDEHQVASNKHGKKGKKKEITEPSKSDHHSD